MPWTWAALMPHPPIIIPEVGHGREKEAATTLSGAEQLLSRLSAMHSDVTAIPDVLLILSPHHAHARGALFINIASAPSGSLAPFGAASVAHTLRTPPDAVQALADHLRANRIPVICGEMEDLTPDHGTLVPLHILSRCFPNHTLPPVIVANPVGMAPEAALHLGEALARFTGPQNWALVASGDLSHRLKQDGPGGFSPDGAVFDDTVIKALRSGDPGLLLNLPLVMQVNAGECGLRSVLTLMGLCNSPVEVLSYEAPFGVGYCNALWTPGSRAATTHNAGKTGNAPLDSKPAPTVQSTLSGHPYPRLARLTVQEYLSRNGSGATPGVVPGTTQDTAQAAAPGILQAMEETVARIDLASVSADADLWNEQRGCFVSIKTRYGDLRGCIGTILPTQSGLGIEIMANAIAAATRDPRFPPMRLEELPDVRFSVDVLGTPEPVDNFAQLDPAKWGVIVTRGSKRGLLLPDLPGVETVQQQVSIAMQKGDIHTTDGMSVQRFSVTRYSGE